MFEGWVYYEKRSTGLGDYFEEVIHRELWNRLPKVYANKPFVVARVQKLIVDLFPWLIFYVSEESEIRVIAILDGRTKPEKIAATLDLRIESI